MRLTVFLAVLCFWAHGISAQDLDADASWNTYETKPKPKIKRIEIRITPNPATDFFEVVTNGTVEKITLLKVIGKYTRSYQHQSKISISDLQRGIYLAKVKLSNGEEVVKKVILR